MTPNHNRATYNRGCRCELCCKANRDYQRAYWHRRQKKLKEQKNESST